MIGIGDVLVTRGSGWAARLIRLGAALMDEPNIDNHIAIVHHQDKSGTWWAIEGRPGGVGWVDAKSYLASNYTTNNAGEPKTDEQRQSIATAAEGMLGVAYDWSAIVTDALMVAHLDELWSQDWNGQGPPAHVVCSSLAAYLYDRAGVPRPTYHEARLTTPGDWEQFIVQHNYAGAAH